jgi:hypothetical protein
MNREMRAFEDNREAIPFSSDFVGRVLQEAKRRRTSARRNRTLGAGGALLIALVMVGRGPMHLGRDRAWSETSTLLAMSDLDAADVEMAPGLSGEEDADADPGSYFVPATEARVEAQTDDGDDPDTAILGQE